MKSNALFPQNNKKNVELNSPMLIGGYTQKRSSGGHKPFLPFTNWNLIQLHLRNTFPLFLPILCPCTNKNTCTRTSEHVSSDWIEFVSPSRQLPHHHIISISIRIMHATHRRRSFAKPIIIAFVVRLCKWMKLSEFSNFSHPKKRQPNTCA